MHVLVTGGAGYIGSHTVRLLVERGDTPVVLDRLRPGRREAVTDAPLVVGDVSDERLLDDLFGRYPIEAAIHLAADKSVEESVHDPGRYFQNNVCGSLALLRAAQRAGVRAFVFSSTCAVYAPPERLPVTESAPLRPEAPYGESKRIVEQMLEWFDRCHGLRYASLRYFNAAGAHPDGRIGEDWTQAVNLIPVVMKAAAGKSGPVRVFGTDYPTRDGTAIRDYIHVLDLAEAHILALGYLMREDRSVVLNLGTGTGSSVQEVIDTARRVSGVDIPVEYAARRPGDLAAVWADSSLARRLLGWEPRFGLEEIISTAWRWHSTHPDGYADADAA